MLWAAFLNLCSFVFGTRGLKGEHTLRYAEAIVADMARPGAAGAIGTYECQAKIQARCS